MLKSPALPTLCLLTLAMGAAFPLAGCKKQAAEQINFQMGERVTATPMTYNVVQTAWRTQLGDMFKVRVPFVAELRDYSWAKLRADLIAGFTLTLVSIPQAVGFSLILGIPPTPVIACVVIGGVAIDAESFDAVVMHLLNNAIEASAPGGQVLARVRTELERVVIAVEDQGAGVPADRASELFEPFFTTKPDGTGLGLAISRAIARGHGGDLVYDRDGAVTRFVLSIDTASMTKKKPRPSEVETRSRAV